VFVRHIGVRESPTHELTPTSDTTTQNPTFFRPPVRNEIPNNKKILKKKWENFFVRESKTLIRENFHPPAMP
jgi:hypothetical protein